MSHLTKLTIKTVARQDTFDPVEARRQKVLKAIEEQLAAADAAGRGEQYVVTVQRWLKNDAGERVRVQRQRVVRSWFFERDGGCYVQCKYGSKPIALSKDGNAVFVKQISDVPNVLHAFYAAAAAGEFDAALEATAKRQKRA